jgi:flagellar basal-body rod protein FlgC
MFDPLQSALKVSSSGLEAQSKRLRVVSENLANAQSTGRVPGADPYARKTISFESEVDEAMGLSTVRVAGIERDRTPFRVEHNPGHPAADANLQVIKQAREMISMTIDLLRST